MTLEADVQARTSTQLLVELTNAGDLSATTVNAARLSLAVTDTQAEFAIETGIAYDDTNKDHTWAGCKGVIYHLFAYTAREAPAGIREAWSSALLRIAQTSGAAKPLLPASSSVLEPSERPAGVRPDFDRERLSGYTLDGPRSGPAEYDRTSGL